MVKKVKSSSKTSLWRQPISQLEACIQAGYSKLEKAYPKAIASAEKEVARLTKSLKLSKADKSAKSQRLPSPKAKTMANDLAELKAGVATLKADFKKFKAQKKLAQQLEKQWVKKLSTTRKAKKRTQKAGVEQQESPVMSIA